MKTRNILLPLLSSLAFLAAAHAPSTALAQEGGGTRSPTRKPQPHPPAWTFHTDLSAEVEYDDNLFLLRNSVKNRLETNGPADVASGRFRDMESPTDLLFTPSLGIELQGPGLGGRDLELSAEIRNPMHTENPECDYLELSAGLRHALGGRAGRLGLRINWIPERFTKNYLADATDPIGPVTDDERVYLAGRYEQLDIIVEYRLPLVQAPKSGGFSLDGSLEVRLRDRSYDSPFSGRDRESTTFAVALDAGLSPKASLSFDLSFEDSESPTSAEVMILDEPDYGVIFNGDGDATDYDVRTVQSTDRSFEELALRVGLKLASGANSDVRLWVKREQTDYRSNLPFDENYRKREDDRTTFGVAVETSLGKGLKGRLAAEFASQDTARPADPGATGEESDFDRFLIGLSVSYRW